MPTRRQFVKRAGNEVVAIQLTLDTDGFTYRKWGDVQNCKPGDWLVQNNGEVYTVDRETFAHTYREESPGRYRKVSPVWAEQHRNRRDRCATKEGVTHYPAGAYLVSNDAEGTDTYAVAWPRPSKRCTSRSEPAAVTTAEDRVPQPHPVIARTTGAGPPTGPDRPPPPNRPSGCCPSSSTRWPAPACSG